LQGAFTENNDTMSPPRETPWKGIAIVLAILLGAVVIAAALIVGGIMQLGFSLL
jgi:urea transporter